MLVLRSDHENLVNYVIVAELNAEMNLLMVCFETTFHFIFQTGSWCSSLYMEITFRSRWHKKHNTSYLEIGHC